ncbi:MAG: GAF domain-containing protein [Deltaproteobacteria bacterium]|nr:GAF domain-containing protein [Deltaproteobacteria bacterium]
MSKVVLYQVGDQMEGILRDLLVSEGVEVVSASEGDAVPCGGTERLLLVVNLRGSGREQILAQVKRWSDCPRQVLALTDSEQTDTLVEVVSLGEWLPVRSLPDLLDEVESWRDQTVEAPFSDGLSGSFQPVDTHHMPQALLDMAVDVLDARDAAVLTVSDGALFLLVHATAGEAAPQAPFSDACLEVVSWVLQHFEPVVLPEEQDKLPGVVVSTPLVAWPLASQSFTHGALLIRRAQGAPSFDDKLAARIQVLASQLVMALDNALLTESLFSRMEALKRAEERLITMKRDEVLVRRARGMVHEAQAPMAYVQTQVRQLQEPLGQLERLAAAAGCLGEEALHALNEVRAHAEYAESGLTRVVQLFGELSRYSRGRQDVNFQLGAAIKAALEMSQTVNMVELSLTDVSLTGNPGQISQLLVGLLENARLAVEGLDAPPIAVRSWIDGGRVWVEVEDRGVGIPEHALGMVFEPFFTLRDPPGTGLGLSTAREIALDHGGELELYSREGEGTLIRLALPLLQSVAEDLLAYGEE